MTEYQFTRPMPKGVDPIQAGQAIQALVDKHGEARPEHIVDVARDEAHPLHRCFTWDDTEAARLQRLNEARYVLRAIVIVREDRPEQTIRAFVNVEREGAYQSVGVVLSNPTQREMLIAQAKAELAAFARKYHSLAELTGVLGEIAKLESPKPKRTRKTKARKQVATPVVEQAAAAA